MTYATYQETRHFPSLDGLRALSILLVLTWHTNSALLGWFSGWAGVTIFFVLSGYLITTLCLREETKNQHISLGRFYLRRAFRIFPLYLIVLGVYIVAAAVGATPNAAEFRDALPYYLGYMNDFAPLSDSTPFAQSWSLGVEEKFYLVWPLLGFVLLRCRAGRRTALAAALALAPFAFAAAGFGGAHPRSYGAILVGCLLACVLHDERGFLLVSKLVRGRRTWLVVAAFVAAHLSLHLWGAPAELVYPFAAALLVAALVAGDGTATRTLRSKLARHIGVRAYGIYLVHTIFLSLVVKVALKAGASLDGAHRPVGREHVLVTAAIFLVGTACSLAAASLLYRFVEQPMIRFGRGLGRRRGEVPSPVPVV